VEEVKGRSDVKKAIGKKIVNDVINEAGKPGTIDKESSFATQLIKIIQNPENNASIISRMSISTAYEH